MSNEEQMKHIANLISQDIEKDKEIERLNKDLQTAIDICNNRQKEIVRLNNIINKAIEYIKKEIADIEFIKKEYSDYARRFNVVVSTKSIEKLNDILKELKD